MHAALPLGCALLVAGTVLTGVAVAFDLLAPLAVAAVVLGLGQGLVVGAGLGALGRRRARGETEERAAA